MSDKRWRRAVPFLSLGLTMQPIATNDDRFRLALKASAAKAAESFFGPFHSTKPNDER